MKKLLLIVCMLLQLLAFAQTKENYPVDSASIEQVGVPKGEVLKFTFDQSKIFPARGGNTGFTCLRNISPINQRACM